jgi:hypothetical protein
MSLLVALGIALFLIAALIKPMPVDAIVPVGIGFSLIAFPRAFTKEASWKFDAYRKLYRTIGMVLIGVGVLYFVATALGG